MKSNHFLKILSTLILFISINLHAETITELLNNIDSQPISNLDNLDVENTKIESEKIKSKYYPTIDAFGSFSHYNLPTNLTPLDPIRSASINKLGGEGLPFSNNISKVGLSLSMPIFSQELNKLSQKMDYIINASRYKAMLNRYTNQATLVGANASLQYLDYLLASLSHTQASLMETKKIISLEVKLGRAPETKLYLLDKQINQIFIQSNIVQMQKIDLISQIKKITGIHLENSVDMKLARSVNEKDMFALKPLRELLNASEKDLEASKAKLYYPQINFNMILSKNYGIDDTGGPDTGTAVDQIYNSYQIGITIPLFNKATLADIEQKKVSCMKDEESLKQSMQDLETESKSLYDKLILIIVSKNIDLYNQNIEKQESLLRYAKVAYKNERMTTEEYLRYEDALLDTKSKSYEAKAQKWQIIAKLAVIYGNDLKEIIK